MKDNGWHRLRALAVSLAVGGLTLAATGCGGSSRQQGSNGATGHPSASGSPAAVSPANGSRLGRLFPTPAQLPRGWALSGGDGQETDSGSALTRPPYQPVLPGLSCQAWKGVDPQFLLSGERASYAHITVMVGHFKNAALGSVNLAGYYPGWAARQFGLIRALAYHRCGTFAKHDEITGALVRMKPAVAVVPGLGDQALSIKILQVNGPLPDGTYYPGDYLLVVRVGNYLVDVDAPAIPGQSQAKAVDQVTSQLVRSLQRLS
jgi:hypothetical protein